MTDTITNTIITQEYLFSAESWLLSGFSLHHPCVLECVNVSIIKRYLFFFVFFSSLCFLGQSCQTLWKRWASTSFDDIISSPESLSNNQIWPDQSINQISDESPYFVNSSPWSLMFLFLFYILTVHVHWLRGNKLLSFLTFPV